MVRKIKFHELPDSLQEQFHLYEIKAIREIKEGQLEIVLYDGTLQEWRFMDGEGWKLVE